MRIWASTVLILLVVLILIPGANAAGNGRIAFTRETTDEVYGSPQDVWTVDASGARPRRLFSDDSPGYGRGTVGPAFSADGSKLAFQEFEVEGRASSSPWVAASAADGSDRHDITRPPPQGDAYDRNPTWSPDGQRLVFERAAAVGGESIFTLAADGTELRRLTSGSLDSTPVWSALGAIAFVRDANFELDTAPSGSIYALGADGSGLHALTTTGRDSSPNFSAGGHRIVFARTTGAQSWIYVMRADGTHVHRLTHGRLSDVTPAWSPDGRFIVFSRGDFRMGFRIWVMRADGRRPHRVTQVKRGRVLDLQPDWQARP